MARQGYHTLIPELVGAEIPPGWRGTYHCADCLAGIGGDTDAIPGTELALVLGSGFVCDRCGRQFPETLPRDDYGLTWVILLFGPDADGQVSETLGRAVEG